MKYTIHCYREGDDTEMNDGVTYTEHAATAFDALVEFINRNWRVYKPGTMGRERFESYSYMYANAYAADDVADAYRDGDGFEVHESVEDGDGFLQTIRFEYVEEA